ncbi:hypothetical protein KDN24_05435 [Bacillus sp. Bva_UNVM-123]|uniref:hypothetical protein n=1 Tax=Bacillus sp. Bva_UNVM-123 TaxID=2829798 RepID=UPI00391EEBE8
MDGGEKMLDFSEESIPFNVTDLLSSGSALIGLVGVFVLLGLAFHFAPKVIYLISRTYYFEYEVRESAKWQFDGGMKRARNFQRRRLADTKEYRKKHYDSL